MNSQLESIGMVVLPQMDVIYTVLRYVLHMSGCTYSQKLRLIFRAD